METNTPQNSQEMNETLDRLHPETATPDYPAQYLLINEDHGTVIWCESHLTAVRACKASPNGGIIINTATADPATVARALANARQNMNTPTDAQTNPQT